MRNSFRFPPDHSPYLPSRLFPTRTRVKMISVRGSNTSRLVWTRLSNFGNCYFPISVGKMSAKLLTNPTKASEQAANLLSYPCEVSLNAVRSTRPRWRSLKTKGKPKRDQGSQCCAEQTRAIYFAVNTHESIDSGLRCCASTILCTRA